MRLLDLVTFIGALTAVTPALAELRPSPLGDIYESYNDCFKVATKDGIKLEVLGSLGWSRATMTSENGKSVASDLAIFGHTDRAPIILLSAEKGEGLCIVMARLEAPNAFEEFKSAWGGKLPQPDAQGAISFFAEGHPIQLRQTGSSDKPSLSIAVMTPMEGK